MSSIPSPTTRLPPAPDLLWRDDGVPRASDVDDVYYSTSSGLEETREVFFRGCGLPERWAGRSRFTVAELGFGTGLNMAALANLWVANRPSPTARLNLVSVEGRLMSAADATRALAGWKDELGAPLEALLDQWPSRARGVQQMQLGAGICLTLLQDDALAALQGAGFKADAWFLDGFSPAKNPGMWSPQIMREVARLSADKAIVGTYTVAGAVRRGLSDAGFDVAKRPGFGRKRERLEAIMASDRDSGGGADPLLLDARPAKPQSVIVIGAGIAGSCAAHAFVQRGVRVTVLDALSGLEEGTSANPLALVMPRLDAGDTPASRAILDAYLSARSFWRSIGQDDWRIDVEQPYRSEQDLARFKKVMADPPLDQSVLSALGHEPGLLHHAGVAVRPVIARRRLLQGADLRWNTRVDHIRPGRPATVVLTTGERVEADLVVVATGVGMRALMGDASPPLAGRAGQLEWAKHETLAGLNTAIASGRYAVAADSQLVFGASFTAHEGDAPPPDAGLRAENVDGLRQLSPSLARRLDDVSIQSRTGVRATTPDRLPFAGRLASVAGYRRVYGDDLEKGRPLRAPEIATALEGVMAIGGLGARGFMWAPMLAQVIAALAYDEPMPTGRASLETLSPARFLMRDLKRGRASSRQ